jgi:hypothetical protein
MRNATLSIETLSIDKLVSGVIYGFGWRRRCFFAAALIWLLGTFSGIFAPGYVWPGRGALSRVQTCLRSGWRIGRVRRGAGAFRVRRRLGRGLAGFKSSVVWRCLLFGAVCCLALFAVWRCLLFGAVCCLTIASEERETWTAGSLRASCRGLSWSFGTRSGHGLARMRYSGGHVYLSSSRFAVSCGRGFLSRGFLGLRTDVLGDSSKGGSL